MMLPLTTMFVFGPYSMKKFGKLRHRDAHVRAGVPVPAGVEVDAAAAYHLHRHQEVRRLEPGA